MTALLEKAFHGWLGSFKPRLRYAKIYLNYPLIYLRRGLSRIRRNFSNRIFQILSSPLRMEILRLLRLNRSLTYSEIMDKLGLEPTKHAGKFAYHLRSLVKARLIERSSEDKTYRLTDLGTRALEFAQEINEYILKRAGKLLVRSSRMAIEEFDRFRIVESLVKEAQVPLELAEAISLEVEKKLTALQVKYLTAPLIREIVNAVLVEKGLEDYRHRLTRLGLPVYDVTKTFEKASLMKLNVEDIKKMAGEAVLREYTLLSVLPRDIADAYLSGELHFEFLGSWILRPDVIQHDIRLMLTGKFQGIPAKTPKTLTSALNRLRIILYDSSFEVNVDQGLDMFNVFLSPYVKGKRISDVRRILRIFLESLRVYSNVTVNLGLDIGFSKAVAELKVQGVGDGAYGDYEDDSLVLTEALVSVLKREFKRSPIQNLSLTVKLRTGHSKGRWPDVFKEIHELVKLGIPVLMVNMTDVHGNIGFSSHGLRFEPFSDWEAETLAVPMIAGVCINTPRLAYMSRGDDERFWENIRRNLDRALEAFRIRREAIDQRIKEGLLPTLSLPEEPYLRFEAMFSALGLIGLNEAAVLHTGSDLLNPSVQATMLKLLRRIRSYIEEFGERIGLTSICGEEGPSRLLNLDLNNYGRPVLNGQAFRKEPYYTDACIVPLERAVRLQKRLELEESIGTIMNGGSLPVIEVDPDVDAEILFRTTLAVIARYRQLRSFTYSMLITYCRRCSRVFPGYRSRCPRCRGITTIAQYGRTPLRFQPLHRWPPVKRVNIARRKVYGVRDLRSIATV